MQRPCLELLQHAAFRRSRRARRAADNGPTTCAGNAHSRPPGPDAPSLLTPVTPAVTEDRARVSGPGYRLRKPPSAARPRDATPAGAAAGWLLRPPGRILWDKDEARPSPAYWPEAASGAPLANADLQI